MKDCSCPSEQKEVHGGFIDQRPTALFKHVLLLLTSIIIPIDSDYYA